MWPFFITVVGREHFEWIRGALGGYFWLRNSCPRTYPQSDVLGVTCADGWGRLAMNG